MNTYETQCHYCNGKLPAKPVAALIEKTLMIEGEDMTGPVEYLYCSEECKNEDYHENCNIYTLQGV